MAAYSSIKKIFKLYIGKHFSEQGRKIFGHWLQLESNQQEKEQLLKQYWLESEGVSTDETQRDWKLLRREIHKSYPSVTNFRYIKNAAAVVCLILSLGATYYIATENAVRQPVEIVEVIVPYGETKEITLPDSSKVWMDSGSTIMYTKDFKSTISRSVFLSGQATFTVSKNKEKPFIVHTAQLEIEALGTIFTVESYPENLFTTATLEEGRIKVGVSSDKTTSYILNPCDQLVYSHLDKKVTRSKVNIEHFKLIRNGYIILHEVTLKEIFSILERKYGVVFQYSVNGNEERLYSMKFSANDSIEDAMFVIQQLADIQYSIIVKRIIIKK